MISAIEDFIPTAWVCNSFPEKIGSVPNAQDYQRLPRSDPEDEDDHLLALLSQLHSERLHSVNTAAQTQLPVTTFKGQCNPAAQTQLPVTAFKGQCNPAAQTQLPVTAFKGQCNPTAQTQLPALFLKDTEALPSTTGCDIFYCCLRYHA